MLAEEVVAAVVLSWDVVFVEAARAILLRCAYNNKNNNLSMGRVFVSSSPNPMVSTENGSGVCQFLPQPNVVL